MNIITILWVRIIIGKVYSSCIVDAFETGETKRSELLLHLQKQLADKKMVYSKNQLQLSGTIGQGIHNYIHAFKHFILLLMTLGESGLVYKAYINTTVGKELVAVKTGKGTMYEYREQDTCKC